MKSDIKLLTPELRKKVEDRMKECFKIAQKHYGIKFDFPEVRFDIKNWTGGLAYRDRNLVRYNLILLVENEKHYLESTVPHETAHMIVNALFRAGKFKLAANKKRWMPHGTEWKEVMTVLSTPAAVKHTYDCTSIEKKPGLGGGSGRAVDRVVQILKRINRLTEAERTRLTIELENIL